MLGEAFQLCELIPPPVAVNQMSISWLWKLSTPFLAPMCLVWPLEQQTSWLWQIFLHWVLQYMQNISTAYLCCINWCHQPKLTIFAVNRGYAISPSIAEYDRSTHLKHDVSVRHCPRYLHTFCWINVILMHQFPTMVPVKNRFCALCTFCTLSGWILLNHVAIPYCNKIQHKFNIWLYSSWCLLSCCMFIIVSWIHFAPTTELAILLVERIYARNKSTTFNGIRCTRVIENIKICIKM